MPSMQESFNNMGDTEEIRFLSDAVINFYAAYVNSLLYPYNHPLISDSLRNAFICLQKVLRRKPNIRIETFEKRLMADGIVLGGDIPVFENFASWLKSKKIKAISFTSELTRRNLISFHKIISTKKLSFEEISNAISEKNITGISIHTEESHIADTGQINLGNIDDDGLIKDYMSTMFYMEKGQGEASFTSHPLESRPLDNSASSELIKDYISTKSQSEISEGFSFINTNSVRKDGAYQAEDMHYAEYVESLIDHDISREEQYVIQSISPIDMASLLNAMLFKSPSSDVVDRIIKAYFGETSEIVEAPEKDKLERTRLFFTNLKSSLKSTFESRYASLYTSDNLHQHQETESMPDDKLATDAISIDKSISSVQPDFIPCRMLEGSDFIFDFVINGKPVIHDIEIQQETANLFNQSNLSHYEDEGILNNLSSKVMAAVDKAEPYSSIIAECTEEAITEAFFDVMINLIESKSLDDYLYRKLEGRLMILIELFLEKGEFEKILDIYNSLKTQSLQGKWSAIASAMIMNIFSSNKINSKLIESLRLYGKKQKESVLKLIGGLRSFLIPYLLEGLCEESNTSTRRFMMTLLTSVKSDVLEHISKYLRDSRWYVLRNMLYLLRECHGHSYTPEVKNFLEHEVPIVRLEALRTLLSFQDPAADAYVIKFLKSDIFLLQKGAVNLSGAYRIKNAVPFLIRLLREKDIRDKKSLLKKSIIRALARIGAINAINPLFNICTSKSLLHKDMLDLLKIEIFKTIHNYPASTIRPFIKYGIHSNNKEIVAICKELMDRYSMSGAREELKI